MASLGCPWLSSLQFVTLHGLVSPNLHAEVQIEPHEHHLKTFTSQWNIHQPFTCGVGIAHQCQPPGYSLHQSLRYKTWHWKKEWSCAQAVPHHLQSSTSLLPPLHPWAWGLWRKAGIREAGALPVLQFSVPEGTNQKTTWNKWAWQKWWGGRDCYHFPGRQCPLRVCSRKKVLSHTSAGCFSWSWPFPLRNESQICVAALTQFSGDCLPRLLAGSGLTRLNSAWKRIGRVPHQSTCTSALAAFLALRAITRICHLNWNSPYLLFSLGAVFLNFVYLSLKVNYLTLFELLECKENISKSYFVWK